MKFTRITIEPGKMGGMPRIRGLRLPVATVVGMVAEGMTDKEILELLPDLEAEDIREALRYAAEAGGVKRTLAVALPGHTPGLSG